MQEGNTFHMLESSAEAPGLFLWDDLLEELWKNAPPSLDSVSDGMHEMGAKESIDERKTIILLSVCLNLASSPK